MTTAFEYVFPCIKGIQAQQDYYVSMCPMRLLPRMFLFDEEELVPELRAQRTLNKGRLPEISQYILENPESYAFSAITASIDGDVSFEPIATEGEASRIGLLHIPMSARFIINDGQHRRAAIELALRENPEIGDESIAVVFFLDPGLERCQQMFADLNRTAIRPSRSLGLLYEHRDESVGLTKYIVLKSEVFKDCVEMERSTLSARSRKLFTLSAVHTANTALLEDIAKGDRDIDAETCIAFWEEIGKSIPEWKMVRDGKLTAGDIRRDFIHSHGIALHALGRAGNCLLKTGNKGWKSRIKKLGGLNWSRSNAEQWEGRAIIGGGVSKTRQNVVLTSNVLKKQLGVDLSPEEQRLEDAFLRGDNG